MLIEPYLKARYFQGRAEGAAAERQKWRGWLERKATAEREDQPFDEPPPDEPPGKNGK